MVICLPKTETIAVRHNSRLFASIRGSSSEESRFMREKPYISLALRDLHDRGVAAMQHRNWNYTAIIFKQVLRQEPGMYECRAALRACQVKSYTSHPLGLVKAPSPAG
jgi:hypothetical protein